MHSNVQKVYLFDANIWLLILGPVSQPDHKQQKYINFFKTIFQSDAIILLPSILVSEIINRLMHFQMIKFAKKRGDNIDPTYFKKVYREHPAFKLALQQIYDDLLIYAKSCTLINDQFGEQEFSLTDLFTSSGAINEFNDNYLYRLAKFHSAIIVTDDGDFLVEDIQIYTLNSTLISKATAKAIASSGNNQI